MLIYLNTEFTDLSEPYLISVGMVTAGRRLYLELSGVGVMPCSPFVRESVLPLLEGPVVRPIAVADRIAQFLAPCGGDVTFFCDSPRYDVELLGPFLPAQLRLAYAVRRLKLRRRGPLSNKCERLHSRPGCVVITRSTTLAR